MGVGRGLGAEVGLLDVVGGGCVGGAVEESVGAAEDEVDVDADGRGVVIEGEVRLLRG